MGVSIKERRIDKYLAGRFRNLSRRFIQNAIRGGTVKVNGDVVKCSFLLSHRDVIEFVMPEPPSKEIEPEDIPLDIVYEDDDLIIVNKAPDMIVHPARGNKHGTLVNALAYYSDQLSSGLGEFRPGIVHRLDRNTTGVIIVAKNDTAQWKIAKQFELRQVKKSYLAIVHGAPELDADRINAPLGVHPKFREKYAVRPETGKEAVTIYEVIEAFRGYSLIQCKPRTGRTHQIRVHMAHVKHPIVADDMYGRQAGLSLATGRCRAGRRGARDRSLRPACLDDRIHPPHQGAARQIRGPLARRHAEVPGDAPAIPQGLVPVEAEPKDYLFARGDRWRYSQASKSHMRP